MKRPWPTLLFIILSSLAAGRLLPQTAAPPPRKKAVARKSAPTKAAEPASANKGVQKIQQGQTRFDASVDGLPEPS